MNKNYYLFIYNIQNNLTIILTIMCEGAEAEWDILTLELGDLKEALVSTKRNCRLGRGLQNVTSEGGGGALSPLMVGGW